MSMSLFFNLFGGFLSALLYALCFMIRLSLSNFFNLYCRFLRRILPKLRTMESGCDIKAELGITICTRNIETLLLTVLLSKCTLRWLLVTEYGLHAFRSSGQPQYQPSCAREKAQSSSITPKSSSL